MYAPVEVYIALMSMTQLQEKCDSRFRGTSIGGIGVQHAYCGSDTETAHSAINFCADGSCEHSLAVDLIDDNYTVAHISIAK